MGEKSDGAWTEVFKMDHGDAVRTDSSRCLGALNRFNHIVVTEGNLTVVDLLSANLTRDFTCKWVKLMIAY